MLLSHEWTERDETRRIKSRYEVIPIPQELLRELVSVKQQRRSPTLCYILPHGTDRAGREAAMRPLRLLDEYGIGYLAVLADGGGA